VDHSAGASAGGKPETVRIRLLGGFSVSVGDRSVWKDAWRLTNYLKTLTIGYHRR